MLVRRKPHGARPDKSQMLRPDPSPLPISYTGKAATPANISALNQGIAQKWSGQFGKYTVETKVVSSVKGTPTNHIVLENGKGDSKTVIGGRSGGDNISGHWQI